MTGYRLSMTQKFSSKLTRSSRLRRHVRRQSTQSMHLAHSLGLHSSKCRKHQRCLGRKPRRPSTFRSRTKSTSKANQSRVSSNIVQTASLYARQKMSMFTWLIEQQPQSTHLAVLLQRSRQCRVRAARSRFKFCPATTQYRCHSFSSVTTIASVFSTHPDRPSNL